MFFKGSVSTILQLVVEPTISYTNFVTLNSSPASKLRVNNTGRSGGGGVGEGYVFSSYN